MGMAERAGASIGSHAVSAPRSHPLMAKPLRGFIASIRYSSDVQKKNSIAGK